MILALAATAGAPSAEAASSLLWTDLTDDTIGRAGLDGSSAVPAFITGASSPSAVVVRGRYVYWVNSSGGSIGRANLDGSGVVQNFISGIAGTTFGLAVGGSHVYWSVPFTNRIGRANIDGSGVNQVFMTAAAGLSTPGGLALDATHLYWTNVTAETIGRANLDGTGVVSPFLNAGAPGSSPYGLAVDDSHIYWTNDDTDAVSRADLNGGGVNLAFVPAGGTMRGLAVDAGGIYWGDNAAGTVGRANLDGSGANPALLSSLTDVGGVGLRIDAAAAVPGSVDFGARAVETGLSPASDIAVRNTGNTTLDVGAVELAGDQAPSFAILSDGCGARPLEVGTACTVRVAFQALAEGPAVATLRVDAAGLGAPVAAGLAGSGVADVPPPGAGPSPGPAPDPGEAPVAPAPARLVVTPSAGQERAAAGRSVVTVRVPAAGRLTGSATATVAGRRVAIAVAPVTARRAGPVRVVLRLPAAVRAEIARRGRLTARLTLRLARAAVTVGTARTSVRLVAPPSRLMPGQWLGRRLGPWRTAPPLGPRERRAVRVLAGGPGWSAVVVR